MSLFSTTTIKRSELWKALATLIVAMGLQIIAWINSGSRFGSVQTYTLASEAILLLIIALAANQPRRIVRPLYRMATVVLLGVITIENTVSFFSVLSRLITEGKTLLGHELLIAALAIFLTNIIVFTLWYWEIDSPGLSGKRWSKHDKDFQFTQQDLERDFADWQPQFVDYLYLSVTNAVNFAPADARPLTHKAKLLMGIQSLLSVLILALVVARSVSILGQ